MQHQPPEAFAGAFAEPHPASEWTTNVKVLFLDSLSQRGNVRAACRRVGLSAETAYRQRRRDPVFARAWAAAMALARKEAEQVLATCAIDGIEEEVWYRGELRGTRVRFDSRLLLAHLARLDLAVGEDALADADRFDELLAMIAGEEMPGDFDFDEQGAPIDRESFVAHAVEEAEQAVRGRSDAALDDSGEIVDDDEALAFDIECETARDEAFDAADAAWDEWLDRACEAVDAILDGSFVPVSASGRAGAEDSLGTVSTVSTPGDGDQIASSSG